MIVLDAISLATTAFMLVAGRPRAVRSSQAPVDQRTPRPVRTRTQLEPAVSATSEPRRDAVGISSGTSRDGSRRPARGGRERLSEALSMPPGQRREAVSDVVRSFPWWSEGMGRARQARPRRRRGVRVLPRRIPQGPRRPPTLRMAGERLRPLANIPRTGAFSDASKVCAPQRQPSGKRKRRSAAPRSSASSIRPGPLNPTGRDPLGKVRVAGRCGIPRHVSGSSWRSQEHRLSWRRAEHRATRPHRGSSPGSVRAASAPEIAQIRTDAANVAKVERIGSPGAIRTNCAVLDLDTENANQNLPSPDQQLTDGAVGRVRRRDPGGTGLLSRGGEEQDTDQSGQDRSDCRRTPTSTRHWHW